MASLADISALYAGDVGLLNRVGVAVGQHPDLEPLFVDIAHFFTKSEQTEEPGSKRRKKNDGSHEASNSNGVNGQANGKRTVVFEIKDVSFTMPQRKKLHFSLVHHGDDLTSPNTYSLEITDPKTNSTELSASLSSYTQVLCLPVPEKPQPCFNYCFIPSPSNPLQDAVVFTLPAGRLTSTKYTYTYCETYSLAFPEIPSYPTCVRIIDEPLDRILPLHNLTRIEPDGNQFTSFFPEIQRKKEPAYHVKAHVGTKDGFLFFLRTGIFFGFKKPLKFLPLENIESTAFVRPVSRTFSLAITYRDGGSGDDGEEAVQEIEFDQIDNQEHGGINEYIQKNGIQDGSFAASRKAKIVKKDKGGAAGGATGEANGAEDEDEDGRTELEKAEQQIQDEEDEEEEDYEPDDDDDEDESGSESGNEREDGKRSLKRKDLVKEELGSEAEDVSDDDDDDDGDEDVQGGKGVEGEEDGFGEEEQDGEDEEEEQDVVTDRKGLPQRPPEAPRPGVIPARRPGEPDPEDDDQL